MLRGIPVVASDSGGLVEAKRGTGYVIPVQTIERYQPVFDEHAHAAARWCRENDAAPWVAAVANELAHRPARLRAGIGASVAGGGAGIRRAAWTPARSWKAYLLLDVCASQADRRCARRPPAAATIESLSPGKRALLLERLHADGGCGHADAHPAGAELALLPGARRRRQIQPAADGSAGRARPRVPRGGAHQRVRRARNTRSTWRSWRRAA